jgi:hypothetical protein
VNQTKTEYFQVIQHCRDLFVQKNKDYGTSWQIMRLPSITDQIFIKARRIRSIQETGTNKVGENIENEFVGIINYCVIALLLMQLQTLEESDVLQFLKGLDARYDDQVAKTWDLLERKNHDYGEAWREMRVSSLTDIILSKLLRLKQIEDNEGLTLVSEGPEGSYRDMLNYAVFALIKLTMTPIEKS